jgi:nitrite reductase (NO-forming)
VIPQQLGRRPAGAPVDRSGDRLVALTSTVIAAGFLATSLASFALPAVVRHGLWLPLHLALAGGALTAIAGVMPFFVAAFAGSPPADMRLRASGVAASALGAAAVALGVTIGGSELPIIGGVAIVIAVAAVGAASLRPTLGALGASRGLVTRAYLVALFAVAVGAGLAVLLFAGWPPITAAWPRIKPAHAWLNLYGFVSLVIATTLLHFFPTVIGARIGNHRSGRTTVVGIAGGAWLTAVGYVARIDLLAVLGSIITLVGALSLVRYASLVWPTRGRWTTDLAWHRFAIGGLMSAIAWFVLGTAAAAVGTAAAGGEPGGWSVERIGGPLVAGWAGLAVMASASHLIPAIGPGGPAEHARQRAVLGQASVVRLVLIDLGVAGLWLAGLTADPTFVWPGLALVALGGAWTVALIGRAASLGLRARPQGSSATPRTNA